MNHFYRTFYIVDAFSYKPFGGNPAGVVLVNGDFFPDERLMAQIAAELRYSETAFVLRHSEKEFSLRYFTPCKEIDICGHATIAAFSLLKNKKEVWGQCLCHTHAGDLKIDCSDNVMIQMVMPRIVKDIADEEIIYRAIGINSFIDNLPVKIVSTGLPDIMVQVPDVNTLNSLKPDMNALCEISKKNKVVSFHVFALAHDNYIAHVRNFSPLYGIFEESATGTSNASLTHYLQTLNIISSYGDFSFVQGELIGRPSIINIRVASDGTVFLGGAAVIIAKGELLV